jgi:RNA polymerase sigma-70 factor (ECF subfamily)
VEERIPDDNLMVGLVERAQAGERQAFCTLVESHSDRIYGYLLHMLGDREEAADLAQETFVRAWEALDRFRGGAAFSTWLYRIATNLAIDALRRRKRRGQCQSLDEPVETNGGEVDRQIADPLRQPDEVLAAAQLQNEVWRAVSELSPKLRAVLLMYDFEQFCYEDIARTLKVPVGTVKSRLFNARQQVKAKLSERLPMEEYLGCLGDAAGGPGKEHGGAGAGS